MSRKLRSAWVPREADGACWGALAVASEVGGVALALDAKDDRAATWYERFGALRLLDDPLKLIVPLDTIAAALKKQGKRRTKSGP
ncbi:MAG TPA: hypothetical protein VMO26_03475 [Vicinamibacterales bacterium]|nr:hypothetical protein [Vicinamibacterales bacterium]